MNAHFANPVTGTPRRDVAAGEGFLAQASTLFDRLRTRFEEHARYVRTRDELLALSERELEDIGITRGDIEHVARRTASGFAA